MRTILTVFSFNIFQKPKALVVKRRKSSMGRRRCVMYQLVFGCFAFHMGNFLFLTLAIARSLMLVLFKQWEIVRMTLWVKHEGRVARRHRVCFHALCFTWNFRKVIHAPCSVLPHVGHRSNTNRCHLAMRACLC